MHSSAHSLFNHSYIRLIHRLYFHVIIQSLNNTFLWKFISHWISFIFIHLLIKLIYFFFQQTAELIDVRGEIGRPSVTFHTVLDRPVDRRSDFKTRRSGNWKNIFNIQNLNKPNSILSSHQEMRGSHREINIDEAILPENKPLNHRPRPRSEMNLSYSVQVRSRFINMGIMKRSL